jgi:hypothetical protein
LKIARIFLAARAAEYDTVFDRRFFKSPHDRLTPFKVAITDHPHLGISMRKGDVSETTLRVFIKQPGSYARVPEKIKHDLGFHEIGGGADFFHWFKSPVLPCAQECLMIAKVGRGLINYSAFDWAGKTSG